jgi:hypothetical protein
MTRTIDRLRGEFLEMPGLRLTPSQAERLCGLNSTMCRDVLDALVASGFLSRGPDGSYALATEDRPMSPLARAARRHIAVEREPTRA